MSRCGLPIIVASENHLGLKRAKENIRYNHHLSSLPPNSPLYHVVKCHVYTCKLPVDRRYSNWESKGKKHFILDVCFLLKKSCVRES